jgi:hypothetical protein
MKTIINNPMEKFKKILWFYILGTILTFWILVLIRKNYILFHDHFYLWSWRFVLKTTIISGVPIGAAIWVYLAYKSPSISLDFNYFINLFKNYFIGILLAIILVEGMQLYAYFNVADYFRATSYNIKWFSLLLGAPVAIVFHSIKSLKQ